MSLIAAALLVLIALPARADDRIDLTTTWFQEPREGGKGLTVLHPQLGLAFDVGELVELGMSYQADIVSGATPAVYSVDAVSSATEFSDTRHAGNLSLALRGRMVTLGVTGGVGVERDYLSLTGGVTSTIYFPGKNTELALAYTHNFDQVCDKQNADANGSLEKRPLTIETCELGFDKGVIPRGVDLPDDGMVDTVWRDLDIDTVQGTLTQILTPTSLLQLGLFGQVLDGFQENPYRRVRVGAVEAQENVPDVRGRSAAFLRYKKYLASVGGAVGMGLRGYADTWGVEALSAEMTYDQYAGDVLLVSLRARAYQQTQAKFFKDAFFYQTEGTAGAFFTGDRELAPLRNVLGGAKLAYVNASDGDDPVWGLFDEVDFHLKAELLFYDELEAESTGPNTAGTDDQFITSDGLVDALLVQLGLRMRY